MSENSTDMSIILSEPNPDSIANLHSFFQKMPIRYQIISLSPDESSLKNISPSIFTSSYLEATEKLTGKLVFWMHSDFEVPLAEVISFIARFYENPEVQVLFGDRFSRPKKMSAPELKSDRAFRLAVEFLARLVLGLESQDLLCPFIAFRSEVANQILSNIKNMNSAGIEQRLRVKSLGMKFQILPVLRTAVSSRTFGSFQMLSRFLKKIFEILSLKLREH